MLQKNPHTVLDSPSPLSTIYDMVLVQSSAYFCDIAYRSRIGFMFEQSENSYLECFGGFHTVKTRHCQTVVPVAHFDPNAHRDKEH